ncbi:MAG: thiolase domain-containing protein [Methanobacteriota archaeon]|nr:MAG: thiolase domain-containing protein [Euryarchaeota archaeon]
MTTDVAIVGAGVTKFGKRDDVTYRELLAEAAAEAFSTMDEVYPQDLQGLYVSASMPELTVDQAHVGNLAAQELGVTPKIVARIEMACSSGSTAIRNAWAAIKSGMIDTAIVVGLEKMTHNPKMANKGLCIVPDVEYESINGITAYSGFALAAREHMMKYGTTREQLSLVAVKNHSNAAKNEKAQFHSMGEITLEKAMNARMVSDPLNLFDCSPITDGGAAVVLTRGDLAKKFTDQPIWIKGAGQSIEPSLGISNMPSIVEWNALKRAAKDAYNMAGVEPKDIDVAETHDCFTIAEIIEYEDLGFVEKGQGGKFIENGESRLDGSLPVNPSGGLKAKGHPIGATGVAQIAEITSQLRGTAGKRQVKDAKIGLTHNLAGFATHHVVHILSNEA